MAVGMAGKPDNKKYHVDWMGEHYVECTPSNNEDENKESTIL